MIRLASRLRGLQTKPLGIRRGKHIDMPCEERIRAYCWDHNVWQDYNTESVPQFRKEDKVNEEKTKEKIVTEKNTSLPPYDKMTADELAMIASVYG